MKMEQNFSGSQYEFKDYLKSKYLESALYDHAKRSSTHDANLLPKYDKVLSIIENKNREAIHLYESDERKTLTNKMDKEFLNYLIQQRKGCTIQNLHEPLSKKYSPTLPNLFNVSEINIMKRPTIRQSTKNISCRESFIIDKYDRDKNMTNKFIIHNSLPSLDNKDNFINYVKESKTIKHDSIIEQSSPQSLSSHTKSKQNDSTDIKKNDNHHLEVYLKPIYPSVEKILHTRFKFNRRQYNKKNETYNKNVDFKDYYLEMKQHTVSPKSKDFHWKNPYVNIALKSLKTDDSTF